jgi:hypothetical protein
MYHISYSEAPTSPHEVLCDVPQESVLGPPLFNYLTSDLCGVARCSNCLLFADDVFIFREIKSPHDSLLLQSHINSVVDVLF